MSLVQGTGDQNFGASISTPALGSGFTSGNTALGLVVRPSGAPAISSVTDDGVSSGAYTLVGTVTSTAFIYSLYKRENATDSPTELTCALGGDALFTVFLFESTPIGALEDSDFAEPGSVSSISVPMAAGSATSTLLGCLNLDSGRDITGADSATELQPYEFGSPPGSAVGSIFGLYRTPGASGSQSLGATWSGNAPAEMGAFCLAGAGGGASVGQSRLIGGKLVGGLLVR